MAISETNQKSMAKSIASIMHQNMMVDPGDLGRLRVKKDVLYKPLLRGFRCFYRGVLSEKICSLYQNGSDGQNNFPVEKLAFAICGPFPSRNNLLAVLT